MTAWAGKTAFISGGASGIGLGMAEAFGSAGMRVTIADIEAAALDEAAARLADQGILAEKYILDVRDQAAFKAAADAMIEREGRIDILCNNAGVVFERRTDDWTDVGWRWLLDVNLMGIVHGIQAFLPALRRQGYGHIVNTGSLTGLLGRADIGQYSSSKFAITGLSQCMRDELAGTGIGVSVLCPGMVMTRIIDATRNAPPAVVERLATSALGPVAYVPKDVAGIRNITAPAEVFRMVLDVIAYNVFYILTDLTWAQDIKTEQLRLQRDIDWLAGREANS